MYYINIRQKALALSIGALLGVNSTTALTAEYGPLKGNNLVLNNGDTIKVDASNASSASNMTGIDSTTQGGGITINGAATINVTNTITGGNGNSSSNSNGILLSNKDTANNLGDGTAIEVNSSGGSATGLFVKQQTGVTANNLTINVNNTSGTAVGIDVVGGSNVDLGQGGQITVAPSYLGYGMSVEGGSSVKANGIAISQNGGQGYGIYINNGSVDLGSGSSIDMNTIGNTDNAVLLMGTTSKFDANQLTITTNNAYGINVQNGAQANLGSGSSITTAGNYKHGVWSVGDDAVFTADNITIATSGSGATGLAAQEGGNIDVGAGSHITTALGHGISAFSNNSAAMSTTNFKGDASNRNSITISREAGALAQGVGGTVNLDNTDITANSGGNLALGVWAINGGKVNANNVSFNMSEGTRAVDARNGGTVSLTGNTTINGASNNRSALYTQGANSTINLTGKASIKGNIYASGNGSLIDLNMDAGSILTGASAIDTLSTAKVNLAMTGSTWNMTDSSTVTNLTLNNSTVNFANTGTTNRANNFTTLTTDTLQGNGLFNINTDIVGQTGDQIIVNGTATGNHQLNIANSGSAATDGTETLTVVTTGSNQANFSLANKVELGAYEYGLRASPNAANNVELFSVGPRAFTTTAQAASSFLNIGYLTNYIENQTMLQRLGDLRNSQGMGANTGGLWIKGFGGKLSSFAGNSLAGFEMNYTGTQAGIDKVLDVNEGNLVIGAMAGYTRTNPNYRGGDGNGKNYTAGLYATYFLDNGFYVDTVLKYNSMRNHFNVKDSAGTAVKGTGKTQGISVSTEIGKRFWLAENNSGLYIEPQAQLSYGYQSGDTVSSSNGLKVGLSHYNSTLGRVGAVLGYQIQGDNPLNVYLKSGVVREMSGGASFKFNDGNKHNHSFRSNWFDNGIGITMNINKKHNIYAEFDYAKGNNFDKRQLDVGYRYSF